MSKMNDIFQVDYLPEKREIRINLPEEVWKNINTIVMTRLFQEELVVGKQEESEIEYFTDSFAVDPKNPRVEVVIEDYEGGKPCYERKGKN